MADMEVTTMEDKYKCPDCNGEKEYEVSNPEGTFKRSCDLCHGSGERLVEIPAREHDRLTRLAALVQEAHDDKP